MGNCSAILTLRFLPAASAKRKFANAPEMHRTNAAPRNRPVPTEQLQKKN